MQEPGASARRRVRVPAQVGIAPDHAGEVSPPVGRRRLGRLRGAAEAQHRVVRGQVRTACRPRRGPRDVLPPSAGEEAVVTTGHQLGAVGEGDAVGGLRGAPVRQHLGLHVPPVGADHLGADDAVTDPEVRDPSGAPVGQQDRRVRAHAVHARMAAAPERVDRVGERHGRALRHLVQGGLGADLVQGQAGELGHLQAAQQTGDGGQPGSVPGSSRSNRWASHRMHPVEHTFGALSTRLAGLCTSTAAARPRPAGAPDRRPGSARAAPGCRTAGRRPRPGPPGAP